MSKPWQSSSTKLLLQLQIEQVTKKLSDGSLPKPSRKGHFDSLHQLEAAIAKDPVDTVVEPETLSDEDKISLLKLRFRKLIEAQRRHAVEQLSDPFWTADGHNIGNDKIAALNLAEQTLERTPETTDARVFVESLLERLGKQKIAYDFSFEDPDGFGAGTFHSTVKWFATSVEKLGLEVKFEIYEKAQSSVAINDRARIDADKEIDESLNLAKFAFHYQSYRAAFILLEIHLLQLAHRLFLRFKEVGDEDLLLFRSRISRVRAWMLTAAARGFFAGRELSRAFRAIAGTGSFLSFIQLAKKKSVSEPLLPNPPHLPFFAFDTGKDNSEWARFFTHAANSLLQSLEMEVETEGRAFAHAMVDSLSEMALSCDENTTVLNYLSVSQDAPESRQSDSLSPQVEVAAGVWCFRVEAGSEDISCTLFRIGDNRQISTLVHQLHVGASQAARHRQGSQDEQLESSRTQLSELLLGSLEEPQNPFGESLVIVADSFLSLVPFAALRKKRTEKELALEHSLTIATALRDLSRKGWSTFWRRSLFTESCASESVLVMGDATFLATEVSHLDKLSGSREDAITVAGILGTRPVLDELSTAEFFRHKANSVALIHLATHGEVALSAVAQSSLDRFESPAQILEGHIDALQAGRIAFADGYLRSDEISDLDLSSVRFAYLSLCVGVPGSCVPGETVLGLARSFLAAGVGMVIANLLPVADDSAAQFASTFYIELLDGHSLETALTSAQRRTARTQPWFMWAGYQLCL